MNYTKLSRITLNYPLTAKYVLWCFPEQVELKHELQIMSEHLPHPRCNQLGRSALGAGSCLLHASFKMPHTLLDLQTSANANAFGLPVICTCKNQG